MIVARSAKLRRVRNDRVDDEGRARIVLANVKADRVVVDAIAYVDRSPDAVERLVRGRLPFEHRVRPGVHRQHARRVQHWARAVEVQRDVAGVRVRRDDEVVFDVVIAWIEKGVNTRIQAGISKRLVGRNVSVPPVLIVSDEIADSAVRGSVPLGSDSPRTAKPYRQVRLVGKGQHGRA